MNRRDCYHGALVADAAAMGLHWMYDTEQLDALAAVGDVLFRQPDANVYAGKKAFFAHANRHAGQLSHYGESARLVGDVVAGNGYSTQAHRDAFMASFGPCGSFCGYADRPTKALVASMLANPDDQPEPSGMDDDQLPALCVLPALYANNQSLDAINTAASVISSHEHAGIANAVIVAALDAIGSGAALPDALATAAGQASGELSALLDTALQSTPYNPQAMAATVGQACHIKQGLPLSWHILKHTASYEQAIRDNTLCGGDSCGRAMIIGSIAGAAYGVPESLLKQLYLPPGSASF